MIRVLSVLHGATYGGPHNHNLQIDAAMRRYGVDTIAALPDEPGNAAARMQDGGMQLIKLPLSRFRITRNPLQYFAALLKLLGDVRRLRRLIKQQRIDLVVLNGLTNPHAAIAAKLQGKAIVWQILDTRPPKWFRRIMMWLVGWLADATMSTGEATFRAHPGWQALHNRNTPFFPPVNIDRFRACPSVRATARQEIGFQDGDYIIGLVANINPQKGLHDFVRTAAQISSHIQSAKFLILGKTYPHFSDYLHSVERLATELGLDWGRQIRILDPADRVPELAQSFDLFCFTPASRSEGMPTAIGEAFALGIPVLSYQAGSINEAVINEQTGYIGHTPQQLAGHALVLFQDRVKYRTLSSNARKFAEQRFSTQRCVDTQLTAYRTALRHRGMDEALIQREVSASR